MPPPPKIPPQIIEKIRRILGLSNLRKAPHFPSVGRATEFMMEEFSTPITRNTENGKYLTYKEKKNQNPEKVFDYFVNQSDLNFPQAEAALNKLTDNDMIDLFRLVSMEKEYDEFSQNLQDKVTEKNFQVIQHLRNSFVDDFKKVINENADNEISYLADFPNSLVGDQMRINDQVDKVNRWAKDTGQDLNEYRYGPFSDKGVFIEEKDVYFLPKRLHWQMPDLSEGDQWRQRSARAEVLTTPPPRYAVTQRPAYGEKPTDDPMGYNQLDFARLRQNKWSKDDIQKNYESPGYEPTFRHEKPVRNLYGKERPVLALNFEDDFVPPLTDSPLTKITNQDIAHKFNLLGWRRRPDDLDD